MTRSNRAKVICGICKATAGMIWLRHPGYQQPDHFDIARCAHCNTNIVVTEASDPASRYQQIYRNAKNYSGYDRYHSYACNIKKKTTPLRWLAKQEVAYFGVEKCLKNISGRILDVGCGLG